MNDQSIEEKNDEERISQIREMGLEAMASLVDYLLVSGATVDLAREAIAAVKAGSWQYDGRGWGESLDAPSGAERPGLISEAAPAVEESVVVPVAPEMAPEIEESVVVAPEEIEEAVEVSPEVSEPTTIVIQSVEKKE
jgi:hypothetical protein